MDFITDSFGKALALILAGDHEVFSAVITSINVAVWSILFASIAGVPLGILVVLGKFPMKGAVQAILNSLMGMPTVVVGLVVYGFLSRMGPLGFLELLFTPQAIIIGETVLAMPVVANYTVAAIRGADEKDSADRPHPRRQQTPKSLPTGARSPFRNYRRDHCRLWKSYRRSRCGDDAGR